MCICFACAGKGFCAYVAFKDWFGMCVCVSRDYVFCTLEAAGKNIEGWNVRRSTSAGSIKTN